MSTAGWETNDMFMEATLVIQVVKQRMNDSIKAQLSRKFLYWTK